MKTIFATIFACLLALSTMPDSHASRLSASGRASKGKIAGVVVDANDARVIGAVVKITGGGVRRTVRSGQEGEFEILLPPGRYRVTAEANGFRRYVSPALLEVKPDETKRIDIRLKVSEPRGLTPAAFISGGH